MLALTYWLESVEPDPEDDSLFRVTPLPTRDINLLGVLSADQRLLVASIVRHQTISTETLAEIYRQPPHETRTELEHLRRLGFIEKAPGQEAAFQMRPLAEGLVTEELRSENLV
jgi:RIO-like serine/threonine protein kinase